MMRIDKAERGARSRRAMVGGGLGAALLAPSATGAVARQTPSASAVAVGDRSALLIGSTELATATEQSNRRIVALTPADLFATGHIPGAVAIDWPAMELGTTTDAAIADWTEAMRDVVASLGIGPASDVIIYDEGTLFAARLWWLLHYLGHDAKRILDGGLPSWQQMGMQVTPGAATPEAAVNRMPETALRPDALAPLAEVEAALGARDIVLVDARTAEEYAAGHIPGAVNVNYPLNAEPGTPRLWKSADALLALYAGVGVTPDKRIIPYCSTGVRSAVTWFTLRMIGFPDVTLFTGSWAEWGVHPELPVRTGSQP